MIIIAFDASIVKTGYAVVNIDDKDLPRSLAESSTIKIKSDKSLNEKVILLADYVQRLCKLHRPEVIIIEAAEGYAYKDRKTIGGKAKNAASMAKNNIAVGVIAGISSLYCQKIIFVSAQEWKGMQRKAITRLVVNNEYKLDLKRANNDEVDAIGIASWYRREQKFRKMMRK